MRSSPRITRVAAGSGGLGGPHGSAFGPGGDLFVGSAGTNEVLRYDGATGAFEGVFVSSSTGLINPVAIHFMRHPADLDNDFDVDTDDANLFAACISGRGTPHTPGCEPSDFDRDGDVDCGDGENFKRGWTGPPSTPPAFSCPECPLSIAAAPEPAGVTKNRSISFVPPNAGLQTAIRVTLSSLNHPAPPANPGPDFSAFEGQVRWVSWMRDAQDNPIFNCPYSASPGGTFRCARLQCEPEYRDWGTELAGATLHVSGSEILPDSIYDVQITAAPCLPLEANFSSPISILTTRWSDVVAPFGAN